MKTTFLLVVLAFAVFLTLAFGQPLITLVHADSLGNDWSMFNHDLAHTGYSTSSAPMTNDTLWTFATGGPVKTSPAVFSGVVYVGSDDGSVYALNAANGSLIWNYSTGGPVQSSPAVVNGVVYIGGFHSHSVFALNASSGALIWNDGTGSVYPNVISSTAVTNGVVYVNVNNIGRGGELDALDAATGNTIWQYQPMSWLWSSPAVYDGKVYFGTDAGQMYALDAVSGKLIWSCGVLQNGTSSNSASQPVDCSVSVGDGLVYLGTSAQTVLALNASTGAFVWSGNVEGGVAFSTVVVANGTVYVSSTIGGTGTELNYGGLCALNAETGESLWTDTLGSVEYSSPAVANGVVFVGSDDATASGPNLTLKALDGHNIYALNATTGGTIWTYETGAAVYSSPAVAYGVVYVGSNDGKVYAIGTYQGPSPSSSTPTPSPTPTSSPTPSPTPTGSTITNPTASPSPSPSVPEFPAWIILPFLLVAWALVGGLKRRLHNG